MKLSAITLLGSFVCGAIYASFLPAPHSIYFTFMTAVVLGMVDRQLQERRRRP
jgi:hypothetical protein